MIDDQEDWEEDDDEDRGECSYCGTEINLRDGEICQDCEERTGDV